MKPMPRPDMGQLRLKLEIAYWRHGWPMVASAIAVVLCLAVWLFWAPAQISSVTRSQEHLQEAYKVASSQKGKTRQEPPLQVFKRQLLRQEETTAQLRLIFQLASNAGLSVSQVDMRRQVDSAGVYSQFQVVLPVRGSYPNIKRFCSDLMQGMPALSIDQLVIRRDQTSASQLDAQLSLSIWQRAAEGKAP
ncbi:type 4a pilus biogenesis protein PilO [Uliginosibacterium gangwonense]|uniref:type 4a pilus biogenesis protein PilO n=1 Tax=Uliginosibacterium gangwonense TaxID=392736 RepID=UPI00037709D9|nr:type 4a pilus biogenesis protein PilO [Uliginosibacterium gangwonense]